MKKLIALAILLLVAIGLLYAGSPYLVAYQLKTAYDAKDGGSIAEAIDYAQLRPRLQSQLSGKFAATLQQYPMVAKLGGAPLQSAADAFINQAVNGAVTRPNIQRLIQTQGQANQATKELAAAWAIASNHISLDHLIQDLIIHRGDVNLAIKGQLADIMSRQADELQAQAASGRDSSQPTMNYCGLDCFRISGQLKGYPITLQMQRQGLMDWKIVNVILP